MSMMKRVLRKGLLLCNYPPTASGKDDYRKALLNTASRRIEFLRKNVETLSDAENVPLFLTWPKVMLGKNVKFSERKKPTTVAEECPTSTSERESTISIECTVDSDDIDANAHFYYQLDTKHSSENDCSLDQILRVLCKSTQAWNSMRKLVLTARESSDDLGPPLRGLSAVESVKANPNEVRRFYELKHALVKGIFMLDYGNGPEGRPRCQTLSPRAINQYIGELGSNLDRFNVRSLAGIFRRELALLMFMNEQFERHIFVDSCGSEHQTS